MIFARAPIGPLRTRLAGLIGRWSYGVSALDQIALSVFGFALNLVLVRALSAHEYGIVSLWMAMALLAISVQRRSHWRQHDRARLYRMLEAVGHWSMLDVFVVALLVGLVRFHSIAEVMPGPGIAAFGAVVVLTMLSSMSLDPRLIWDTDNADDV